jgi:hypothetical protein
MPSFNSILVSVSDSVSDLDTVQGERYWGTTDQELAYCSNQNWNMFNGSRAGETEITPVEKYGTRTRENKVDPRKSRGALADSRFQEGIEAETDGASKDAPRESPHERNDPGAVRQLRQSLAQDSGVSTTEVAVRAKGNEKDSGPKPWEMKSVGSWSPEKEPLSMAEDSNDPDELTQGSP